MGKYRNTDLNTGKWCVQEGKHRNAMLEHGTGTGTRIRRMDTPSVRILCQRSRDLIYTQLSSNSSPAWSVKIEFKPHAEFAPNTRLYAPDGSEREDGEINSLKNN